MRTDPSGESFETWLDTRAPAPLEEVSSQGAGLADAVHAVHQCGAVLRDLSPRNIVRSDDGRIVLTDVGLSRVDVLSSHTASSLLLEGSPYASPEQLYRTSIDQRSDLFGLGVILWRALTGTFPFGDGHALMREHPELPSLVQLRAEVPTALDELIRRCLSEDPADRPDSAAEIAYVLRGGSVALEPTATRTTCQHCGAALRVGQRLCLACGHVAIKFEHLAEGDSYRHGIELSTATEDAGLLQRLRRFMGSIASRPVDNLEFVIGDPMMYSDEERSRRIRLPARLFNDLSQQTALELRDRMKELGLDVRVIEPGGTAQGLGLAAGVAFGVVGLITAAVTLGDMVALPILMGIAGFIGVVVLLARAMTAMAQRDQPALFRLRPAAAALPASDPLVARLAALLQGDPPADVREQVGEMALLIQRLVDHRASLPSEHAPELELLVAPIEPLVEMIEGRVLELRRLSEELATLDEGAMVRALAASEARAEPEERRMDILRGLDRLRALEDARAGAFHRLLEASTLLRRSVNLGLEVHDPRAEHERHVSLALAALGGGED